jgi:signal transduction histidine kinase
MYTEAEMQQMECPPVGANEEARLQALRRYDVLASPPDGAFNRICRLASRHFNTPIALVSMVDETSVWIKAAAGIAQGFNPQVNRSLGMCSFAIAVDEVTVFPDMSKHPCLAANPHVAAERGLRFYAGAQLRTHDGFNLGTLCVLDHQPRTLNEEERATLAEFAALVMDELELRQAAQQAVRHQGEMLSIAAHDLKSPLTAVTGFAELLKEELKEKPGAAEMAEMIERSAWGMLRSINGMLESAKLEEGKCRIVPEVARLDQVARSVATAIEPLARSKRQRLRLNLDPVDGEFDPDRIAEVIANFIDNAVKFSPQGSDIVVETRACPGGGCELTVRDQGPGILPDERDRLFNRFSRLSSRPTGGESSSGLGLYIARGFVELHGGEVFAESANRGGSVFGFRLPAKR